jgi:predicted transcriptional regulator
MARPPKLEQRILSVLWRGGDWSVRDVHAEVDPDLAYTTIATVLDRLHTKGVAERAKTRGAWRYTAARTREATLGQKVARLLEGSQPSRPLLVAFLDHVEEADPEALDQLEALIRARRKEP